MTEAIWYSQWHIPPVKLRLELCKGTTTPGALHVEQGLHSVLFVNNKQLHNIYFRQWHFQTTDKTRCNQDTKLISILLTSPQAAASFCGTPAALVLLLPNDLQPYQHQHCAAGSLAFAQLKGHPHGKGLCAAGRQIQAHICEDDAGCCWHQLLLRDFPQ